MSARRSTAAEGDAVIVRKRGDANFPISISILLYGAHVASDVVIAQSSDRYVIEHNRRSRKLGGVLTESLLSGRNPQFLYFLLVTN